MAKETEAGMMVMGKPIRSPGSNVFKRDEIEDFAEILRKEGNIQVITVSPSRVTGQIQSLRESLDRKEP